MSGTAGAAMPTLETWTVWEGEVEAEGHPHQAKMVCIDSPGNIYLEVWEPENCECRARLPLAEVVHLLLNLTTDELLAISMRTQDRAGHHHGTASPGVAPPRVAL